MQSTDMMPNAIQKLKNSAGPRPILATETGQSAGVPQCISQVKKPSFDDGGDLRLQVAEALVFIQEMTPDLSAEDLFYIERTIDLLNHLVDEDHIDRTGVKEVLAWDF